MGGDKVIGRTSTYLKTDMRVRWRLVGSIRAVNQLMKIIEQGHGGGKRTEGGKMTMETRQRETARTDCPWSHGHEKQTSPPPPRRGMWRHSARTPSLLGSRVDSSLLLPKGIPQTMPLPARGGQTGCLMHMLLTCRRPPWPRSPVSYRRCHLGPNVG